MASIITNRMLEKEVQRYMSEKEKNDIEIKRMNSNVDLIIASVVKVNKLVLKGERGEEIIASCLDALQRCTDGLWGDKEGKRYMSEKDHTEIERLNSNIDSLKALASAIKSISSNGYFSEYNEAKAKGCLRGIRKELPVLKKILKELDNGGKADG